jgi:hypothetical protein
MTGIPQPHSSDEDDDKMVPGDAIKPTPQVTPEWVRVPEKPGFWRNLKTGQLKYIPPLMGVPQQP